MKPKKMTDDDLNEALDIMVDAGHARKVAKVRAHIAALTAERDEALVARDSFKQAAEGYLKNWNEEIATRDALRERVQALEAENERLSRHYARLSHNLAAIRQRAGDASEMADVYARHGGHMRDALAAVARYVLGEDATGAVEGAHKLGTNSEPTTAEAFATVREALECIREDKFPGAAKTGAAALALLERRMGAMGRMIREAPHARSCDLEREDIDIKACSCWKAHALTDAPPVFTLEEVEAAFRNTYSGPPDEMAMIRLGKAFAALRKG